jgi:YfiH family protein
MMRENMPVRLVNGVECYQFGGWLDAVTRGTRLRHGFFTARGGFSSGVYESLNCGFGSNDELELVRRNRSLVAEGLGFATERMYGLRQVHSSRAVWIGPLCDSSEDARAEADALVTDQPNTALTILTADCVPVLFADIENGLIGAAHAGWRGAFYGVLEATLKAMVQKGSTPSKVQAVVGPAIQQKSYQVGDDIRNCALTLNPAAVDFFVIDPTAPDKYLFDLPGFVVWRLRQAGIVQIANLPIDTYSESPNLFSYRHATHAARPDSGRQISVIGLLPTLAM